MKDDIFQIAKDMAKAERELKIEQWVIIAIKINDDVLFRYNLPRNVWENRKWVIRWRVSKLQCEHPKEDIRAYYSFYDKRSGEPLGLNTSLYKLSSAKAQVTKIERDIREYIELHKTDMFFNELTDDLLLRAKGKLAIKKQNVLEAEHRLEELIKKKNNE